MPTPDIAPLAAYEPLVLTPFSWLHGLTVGCLIAVIAALVYDGKRRPQRVRLGLGWVGLAFWLANQGYYLARAWPAVEWSKALPLQVCDVVALCAALALLTQNRWFKAVAWFSAFGLSLQAAITPVASAGPDALEFWVFWGMHGSIYATAVVQVAVLGYRPDFSDFKRAWWASLGYVMLVVPLDLLTGWNYGYMGNNLPSTQTVLDWFGPWPWRIGSLCLITTGLYLLLWLPFVLWRRWKKHPAQVG